MEFKDLVCSMDANCLIEPVTNPLHILECGHYVCLKSLLVLLASSESKQTLTVTCKICNETHDLQFAKDQQKHALLVLLFQKQELLNLKIQESPFFTCKTHLNQAVLYKCKYDG